jgi:hypothetical protein
MTLPQLPFDLLGYIAKIVGKAFESTTCRYASDLCNLALTNRFFREITLPHLFQSIEIQSQARCDSLLNLMSVNTTLASHIDQVTLRGGGPRERNLWFKSPSGRTLMRRVSHATILKLEEINLTLHDVHDLGRQMLLLSSVNSLYIISCRVTPEVSSGLLSYAPKLQHLSVHHSDIIDSSRLDLEYRQLNLGGPAKSVGMGKNILSLSLVWTLFDHPLVLDQYVASLRYTGTGHLPSLRKVTLWLEMPGFITTFWPLLQDAAPKLEELNLTLGYSRGPPEPLHTLTPLHAPYLSVLDLRLGDTGYHTCDAQTLAGCSDILSRVLPSKESLSLVITIFTRPDVFKASAWDQLAVLEALLAAPEPAFGGLQNLTLNMQCQIGQGQDAFTYEEVYGAMLKVGNRCKFICSVDIC